MLSLTMIDDETANQFGRLEAEVERLERLARMPGMFPVARRRMQEAISSAALDNTTTDPPALHRLLSRAYALSSGCTRFEAWTPGRYGGGMATPRGPRPSTATASRRRRDSLPSAASTASPSGRGQRPAATAGWRMAWPPSGRRGWDDGNLRPQKKLGHSRFVTFDIVRNLAARRWRPPCTRCRRGRQTGGRRVFDCGKSKLPWPAGPRDSWAGAFPSTRHWCTPAPCCKSSSHSDPGSGRARGCSGDWKSRGR
jgi:hypothetical protein